MRGVVILVSKNLPFTFLDSTDPTGRYLFINCIINNTPYTLATLYAPNSDQLSFISNTLTLLNDFKKGEVLLGGDLNYTGVPFGDKSPSAVPTKQDSKGNQARGCQTGASSCKHCTVWSKVYEVLDSFNLVDIWHTLYPSARQFTFFSPTHQMYTCIDFIIVSKSLVTSIPSADIGLQTVSDHTWVTCLFAHRVTDGRGPNWSLNKSLLLDAVICETTAEEIMNYFLLNKDCGIPSDTVWDTFKALLRGYFISVAVSCRKAKVQAISELKAKIAFLEDRHRRRGGKKFLRKLEIERKKLVLYETSQAQRNLLFLKHRYSS